MLDALTFLQLVLLFAAGWYGVTLVTGLARLQGQDLACLTLMLGLLFVLALAFLVFVLDTVWFLPGKTGPAAGGRRRRAPDKKKRV